MFTPRCSNLSDTPREPLLTLPKRSNARSHTHGALRSLIAVALHLQGSASTGWKTHELVPSVVTFAYSKQQGKAQSEEQFEAKSKANATTSSSTTRPKEKESSSFYITGYFG